MPVSVFVLSCGQYTLKYFFSKLLTPQFYEKQFNWDEFFSKLRIVNKYKNLF
jgi:hypothetical protein